MGKKLLTFALCLFLGMSVTLAQNRIITGTVTGAEDGFPIPGALCLLKEQTLEQSLMLTENTH